MSKPLFLFFIAALFLILALRFFFFYINQPQYEDGQRITFKTTLLSEPAITSRQQRISANLASGEKTYVIIPLFPEFHYGDTVRISGTLRRKVLSNKKIMFSVYSPKIEAIKNDQNYLLAVISSIRQRTIFLFEKSLPPVSSSLLLGIVFGVKESVSKDFLSALRSSGVLHVIAASGMNVTMVGGFLSFIFALILKRQMALVASMIGILFYAVLSGLDPPIIRASIMGALVFLSQILGRQAIAFYSLFITAFVMLFLNPVLLMDIGFQLSFFATWGLLCIKPAFDRSIFTKIFSTTIAAQIATLPILLANFGTYSLWSILINSLVLWTIPPLMVIGGLGTIVGLLIEPLGQIILYLSLPLLIYFEKVVEIFSAFPGLIVFSSIPWQLTAGYYCLVLSLILKR